MNTKPAVGYVRVSTEQQAEGGESLALQETKIRAMAEVQGVELADVVVDGGASAKSLVRPGMERVLDLVRSRSVSKVIVYKLDRLTRSVRDLADVLALFERHGVALVSVSENLDTGSAAGRLVLNVMASVAQWEREVIGERTREALASKRSKGQRVGAVPFGFQPGIDGALVENLREQTALRLARERRAAGASYQSIADELNRRGHRTRTGRPFAYQNVQNMIGVDTETRRRYRRATEARKARTAIA